MYIFSESAQMCADGAEAPPAPLVPPGQMVPPDGGADPYHFLVWPPWGQPMAHQTPDYASPGVSWLLLATPGSVCVPDSNSASCACLARLNS